MKEDILIKVDEAEEIALRKSAFFAKYPNIKKSENIKSLSLIMKREFAEAILRGEKTVEFRQYSPYYCNRIYDKKLMEIGETAVDPADMEDFVCFARPLRAVEAVHFHDYNNSWFLDVECIDNWTVAVIDSEVKFLQDSYRCHELDDLLVELDSKKATDRPLFFFFALGKVLGTNIQK